MHINIPYRSFCWVIGTTSFRTAKLNLKIEQQLALLNEFYDKHIKEHGKWFWNNQTQIDYYNFMKEKEFIKGDALRKDKDAREKTSGLVDIGLITEDRRITEVGNELLNIATKGNFRDNNKLNIDKDSYIYFKQLLKTSIKVNDNIVRPYIVLAKVLTEIGELSFDEFTYLLPLAISVESTKNIISRIKELRNNKITIVDIIYEELMQMDNYKLAYEHFINQKVSEDLICTVGINRKSRSYDKPYYNLYRRIKNVFLAKKYDEIYELYLASKQINQKPGNLWRKFLFKTTNANSIKKNGINNINEDCPFHGCKSEIDIKKIFFKYLHVFKAMATLSDYFDLNRRYLNLTETLVFEDQIVRFDLLPKYFFETCINNIIDIAFTEDNNLSKSISLQDISKGLVFNEKEIYERISKKLGTVIQTHEQATAFIKDERYRRFNQLIDKKFNDSVLVELLTCFETRDDLRIEELVTDEADIPTIFEYIIAIVWYKVSERQRNIIDYMQLSLEANLLPKTHAAGGYADIIYEYEACQEYPKHSLLIEATLTEGINQRRAEMEPVSRHLGEHRLKYGNPFDYSLFISTYLHKNVVTDFRYRKFYLTLAKMIR
ncbi:MAG TPA: AlwI family type II restriction endonuclease [Pseudobacteroides sp.]|nr:AlwI family type II restriction endonuclease [Pseudobacteroides sp.]